METNKAIAITIVAVVALAAGFAGKDLIVSALGLGKAATYQGVPIVGANALENLKAMSAMPNVTIIVEGDTGVSQKNSLIAQTAVELASFFGKTRGARGVQVYSMEFQNSTAVRCEPGKTIEYCRDFIPQQSSFLVRVKYPAYQKDEVVVTRNTVELHGRDASDALALAYLLEDVMGSP